VVKVKIVSLKSKPGSPKTAPVPERENQLSCHEKRVAMHAVGFLAPQNIPEL
jgi:hypothetical protein